MEQLDSPLNSVDVVLFVSVYEASREERNKKDDDLFFNLLNHVFEFLIVAIRNSLRAPCMDMFDQGIRVK